MSKEFPFEEFNADEYTIAAKVETVIGTNQDGTPKTARYPGAFTSMNPTPYERSGVVDSPELKAYMGDSTDDVLYNDRAPHYAIKHQKPEHRLAILLKAQGNSNKEIAEVLGITPVCVANVLRQPWARKQLSEEINKAGRNEVLQIFKGAAATVAEKVVSIIEDEKTKPSDAIAASHLILDRLFGKATQPMNINLDQSKLKSMSDEELLKIAAGASNAN